MARLEQFLKVIPFEQLASDVAKTSRAEHSTISTMLDTYANESRITLALVMPHLDQQVRLLEVGAGLCFTSLFLRSEGYQITALEPALGGFGIFEQLKKAVLDCHSSLDLEVINAPAQQLDSSRHGQFDFIFSNNVIEHIPDWQAAFTAMTTVLSAHGSMKHACPNYSIPYEPHYGIPVFRHFTALSRRLFLSPQRDMEIWHSLNFITGHEIKRYCRKHSLSCHFEKELLYKALKRIDDDPLFKERHQGLIAHVASFIMRSGLGSLIRRIPPTLSTPMIIEITHQSGEL